MYQPHQKIKSHGAHASQLRIIEFITKFDNLNNFKKTYHRFSVHGGMDCFYVLLHFVMCEVDWLFRLKRNGGRGREREAQVRNLCLFFCNTFHNNTPR